MVIELKVKKKNNSEFILNEETGKLMIIYREVIVESSDIPLLRKILKSYPRCPKCNSVYNWKHGYDYKSGKRKQKHKCKKCGHVWREK